MDIFADLIKGSLLYAIVIGMAGRQRHPGLSLTLDIRAGYAHYGQMGIPTIDPEAWL